MGDRREKMYALLESVLLILVFILACYLCTSNKREGRYAGPRVRPAANGARSRSRGRSAITATSQSCLSDSDCPSAQGGACVNGQCMCGDIPACGLTSEAPYCDESDSSCYQCHTDQVCNNKDLLTYDPPNLYCLYDTCQECNQGTYARNATSKQCLPYGNACDCPDGEGTCACKCRRNGTWNRACDPTGPNPTCKGDDDGAGPLGCAPCGKDSDCPTWRPHCAGGLCNENSAESLASVSRFQSGPHGIGLYDSPHYYPFYEAQAYVGSTDPAGRCRTTCRGGDCSCYRGGGCVSWCRP